MINRKIVCYSCCTGGYDDILQHNVINKDYDYIFFTDNKDLIQKKQIGQWRIRPLVYKKSTNVKNARWHKVNAHLLFPEYEYSLWCDANIIINNEIIYNKINEFIKNGIDFSVPLHPERKCIYEEGEEIKRRQYDSIKTVDAEMNFLKNNNYPVNNGLHETCILFRRHNAIKEMLNCWWKMIKKYSKRDQLSFDYALWKNNTIVHPLYPNGKDHRENGDFTFLYGQNHNSKQKDLKCTWLVSKIIKLFYECEENKVKYRFCGIPLFSIKNNNDKQVVKILGVKFSYKKIGTHKMHINFKNYDNLICDIKNNIHKLPNDIDMIIGVPRSGMVPAYMLGQLLKTPVFSINELLHGIIKQHYSTRHLKSNKIKKILIIDDSLRNGAALKKVQNDVKDLVDKYEILYGAVYVCSDKKGLVDWYAEEVGTPRFFQWNYLNHPEIANACYDIDGVLCKDPTEEENDDGEKYIKFLKTATPLYIPSYKIHALVTSRLEKYRPETEEWLKKNNVQYDNLYMLNLKSKEERIKNKAHGTFKSEIYNKLNNTYIFYESDFNQAAQISTLTKKPVFCVNTDTLFLEGHEVFNKIKRDCQNITSYSNKISIPLFEYQKNKNKAYYKLFGIPIIKIKNKEKDYHTIKKIYILGIPVWRKHC